MTKEEICFYAFIGVSLLYIIMLFVIKPAIRSFKTRRRGKKGEKNIERVLKSLSLPYARILRYCYIPINSSATTEIDVLMICEQGIFVIESKNYKGDVRGREDEQNWTQELMGKAYRPITHLFYNPVWQNENHIKALQNLIKRPDIPMFSVVVFSNDCNLNAPAVCRKTRVLQLFNLKKMVKRVCNEKRVALDSKEINDLYNMLRPYTEVSLSAKREHIKNVNKISGKKKALHEV